MLQAIDNIESIDLAALHKQPLIQLALERSLEVLSEASRHIPPGIKQEATQVRWQDLADLGNLLRHGYHKLSLKILIQSVETDVPTLKTALIEIKAQLAAREQS